MIPSIDVTEVMEFYNNVDLWITVLIIFFIVAFAASLIVWALASVFKSDKIGIVVKIMAILTIVLAFVCGIIKGASEDKYSDTIKEQIQGQYGLIIDEIDGHDVKSLADGEPSSEPYYGYINGDSRIYEVYLVRKGNTMYLYTRNEKGIYLPVTNNAVAMNNTTLPEETDSEE